MYKKYVIEIDYKKYGIENIISKPNSDGYGSDINITIGLDIIPEFYSAKLYLNENGFLDEYPHRYDFIEEAEHSLNMNHLNINNNYNGKYLENPVVKISECYDETPPPIQKVRKYKLNKLMGYGNNFTTLS